MSDDAGQLTSEPANQAVEEPVWPTGPRDKGNWTIKDFPAELRRRIVDRAAAADMPVRQYVGQGMDAYMAWLEHVGPAGQPAARGAVLGATVAVLTPEQMAMVLTAIAQLAATGQAKGLVKEAAAMARRRIRESEGLPVLRGPSRLAFLANSGHR